MSLVKRWVKTRPAAAAERRRAGPSVTSDWTHTLTRRLNGNKQLHINTVGTGPAPLTWPRPQTRTESKASVKSSVRVEDAGKPLLLDAVCFFFFLFLCAKWIKSRFARLRKRAKINNKKKKDKVINQKDKGNK